MPFQSVRLNERIWLPSLLVALFVAQNYLFNEWLKIYPGEFTGRFVLVALSLGVVIYGPAVMLKRKWRYAYLALMSSAVALIFVSQYLYYSYSGGYLQASALMYAGEAMAVTGTIQKLLTPVLFLFVVGPVLVAAAYVLSRQAAQDALHLSRAAKARLALVMLAISVSGYSVLLTKESKEWGHSAHLYQYAKLYDVNMLVAKTGVVNYFLADAVNFALKNRTATPADLRLIADWKGSRGSASAPEKSFGLAKGRNLIFIQVESLENSLIGKKVGDEEITPNLNRLAKEGLYFDNYYAQIGPGNTADAEFSTLNSLYPLSDEVAFIGYADNSYAALPDLLKQNGYQTYAFHGDVPSFWNRANIYPRLGYEKSFSREDYSVPRAACFADLCDGDFLSQSLDKIQSLPQPFMATLITLSSHTPFYLPSDLQTLDVPDDHRFNEYQWGYLESIHYTDAAIGKFIDGLKQNGLYDSSVIVIFGDHGSFTDVSDALGHGALPSDMAKDQVPLIVLAPKSKMPTGTDHDPASHLDVYPTVSALLGIPAPQSVLGQDVLATKNPVAVRRNVITGTVQEVLTKNTLYRSSADGVFENGACTKADATDKLPIDECRTSFDKAKAATQVSDIVVRDNLLGVLSDDKNQVSEIGLTRR